MRGLAGKGVLVTGGASGIGEATAQRFIDEGCAVGILDVDEPACVQVQEKLAGLAGFRPDRVPTLRVGELSAAQKRAYAIADNRLAEIRDYTDLARLGYVTPARITQIMCLLHLAPDIQEALLFLPRTLQGRDPIREKDLRPIAAVQHWSRQHKMWAQLVARRME